MEVQIKIIGLLLMMLAFMHFFIPKYFNWKESLKSLSTMNRQMMKVHTFFIALTVFLMGFLCFTSSNEMLNTALGNKVALGLAIFWTIRMFIQFFGYSSDIWKGKTFETVIHISASIFWTYLTVVFWMCFLI